MRAHTFKNCSESRVLTTLSASWFVSYLYYLTIDSTHLNWKKYENRISYFNNSKDCHIEWLQKIVTMNPLNLSKNQIGLAGLEVLRMAAELLNAIERGSYCELKK